MMLIRACLAGPEMEEAIQKYCDQLEAPEMGSGRGGFGVGA